MPLAFREFEDDDDLRGVVKRIADAARKRQPHRRGRGLFASSGLLEALLAERAKERARG